MSAIKLHCCFCLPTPEGPKQCTNLAVWGAWTGPDPYTGTYGCADHLGHIIEPPKKGERTEVWPLWNGYDPTMCTQEEMTEAFNNDPLHESSPPLCLVTCEVCHPADARA